MNEYGICTLQCIYRFKRTLLLNIKKECQQNESYLQQLSHQLQEHYKQNILSQISYLDQMDTLDGIFSLYTQLKEIIDKLTYLNVTLRNFCEIQKRTFLIRGKIRNMVNAFGLLCMQDILTLNHFSYDSSLLCQFIDTFFVPLAIEIYDDTFTKVIDRTKAKLSPYGFPRVPIEEMTVLHEISKNKKIKWTITPMSENTSFQEQFYGVCCFVPVMTTKENENKWVYVMMYGYLREDPCGESKKYLFIREKYTQLSHLGNTSFYKLWIHQLSLREIMVYEVNELQSLCMKAYHKLQTFVKKSIAEMAKEFVSFSIFKQVEILGLLLLVEEDEIRCVAHLLYDMLPPAQNEKVFNFLHWTIKKQCKVVSHTMSQRFQKLQEFNEEDITYESRIYMMKCSDSTKRKAMEKLKEFQNKSNDNAMKAQQYLDGLLMIPFGYYKSESIFAFLPSFREQLHDYCLQYVSLGSYMELSQVHQEMSQQVKALTSYQIHEYLLTLHQGYTQITTKESTHWHPEIIRDYFLMFTYEQLCEFLSQQKKNLHLRSIEYIHQGKKGKVKVSYKKNGFVMKVDVKEIVCSMMEWIEYCRQSDPKVWAILSLELPIKARSDSFHQMLQYQQQYNTLWKEWENYLLQRQQYLQEVRGTLEASVYGHKDVKRHIEHIIAQWIHGENTGYCFGFEGPPGTGKTSIAKKGLANCFKDENGQSRPFAFIALGGSSNGSTLEGHSYTYVGSTWGKIVEILMETKCMNPIIYIDELDKVSQTEHGREIIGILTHITDPSQNDEYSDKYFAGIKLDLSKVLFIFSYNDPEKIDPILRDRIHRIKFHPLKQQEKQEVCRLHILPSLLKKVGLRKEDIVFPEATLDFVIEKYTMEGGVRKLKERLYEIVSEINLRHLLEPSGLQYPIVVSKQMIQDDIFVDKGLLIPTQIMEKATVGCTNGLYASVSGVGGIILIQCRKIPSTIPMGMELTGQQGDVMKESCQVAKTLAWSMITPDTKVQIKEEWSKNGCYGLHLHCPEGATPKDGPSAGTAIAITILSTLLHLPVNNNVAITGEIDLNGSVTEIGGLEAKIWGAKRAGVSRVLFPLDNEADLRQILKQEVIPFDDTFTYKMVSSIKEVVEEMFMTNYNFQYQNDTVTLV